MSEQDHYNCGWCSNFLLYNPFLHLAMGITAALKISIGLADNQVVLLWLLKLLEVLPLRRAVAEPTKDAFILNCFFGTGFVILAKENGRVIQNQSGCLMQ